MTSFYVMFTDEDGCPSLLHKEAVIEKKTHPGRTELQFLRCCCPAFAYEFSYPDACLVAKVLDGEVVTAEAYEGKLTVWSEGYDADKRHFT